MAKNKIVQKTVYIYIYIYIYIYGISRLRLKTGQDFTKSHKKGSFRHFFILIHLFMQNDLQ